MNGNDRLEKRINDVLSEWNPIDVPELIAGDEYQSYVSPIIAIGRNPERLKEYLKHLVSETLGLGFDESNKEHQQDIEGVVMALIQAFDS